MSTEPSEARREGLGQEGSEPGQLQGPRPPARALTPPRPHLRVNCSEYFPLFLATLWVAGIFFHEGLGSGRACTPWNHRVSRQLAHLAPPAPLPGAAALCGLVYLFARLRYFQGYARSPQQR